MGGGAALPHTPHPYHDHPTQHTHSRTHMYVTLIVSGIAIRHTCRWGTIYCGADVYKLDVPSNVQRAEGAVPDLGEQD